jgi:hypothetical protein
MVKLMLSDILQSRSIFRESNQIYTLLLLHIEMLEDKRDVNKQNY